MRAMLGQLAALLTVLLLLACSGAREPAGRKLSARRGGARSGGSLRNPPRGRRVAARSRFPELKSSLVLMGNAPRFSRRRRLRKSNPKPWGQYLVDK